MSSSKKVFKEKIVTYYDLIFNDSTINDEKLWNELFLLKVSVTSLEEKLNALEVNDLLSYKENINELFSRCVDALREDSQIKIVNALLTLCVLLKCVFKKNFSDFGYDIINILIGFDQAEETTGKLIECVSGFLMGEYSTSLKNLVLKLLLIIVTAVDNVSSNTTIEYLIIFPIFDVLVQIFADSALREQHGYEAVILLVILISYRKHETVNPYVIKLSLLEDELALNGLGLIVSDVLSASNKKYFLRNSKDSTKEGSLFNSLTNFVGSMFVSNEVEKPSFGSENDAILLVLYEAVLTNRTFFTVLSHILSITKDKVEEAPIIQSSVSNDYSISDGESIEDEQSINLMATFLRYSSIAVQDTTSEHGLNTAKLCLTILTCVTEDQYANAFLHDSNMTFSVPIYKMNLYHRKVSLRGPASCPLACVLLDLMVEFCVTHMMKKFPLVLYQKCMGIIHRCLCYQKKCRIRLQYNWKELWSSLMNVLKFILSSESYLVPKFNIFHLCIQIVNVFNLFITYGDTFLPTPTTYDELYYEIIRVHNIFDNLYTMALRYVSSENEFKGPASKLTNCLVNVRAIIHHFSPKIDAYLQQNNKTSLSEEEVLEVLRGNYETLTLKLMEGLDGYTKHADSNESAFFAKLIRSISQRIRGQINVSDPQQIRLLQEFSSIK